VADDEGDEGDAGDGDDSFFSDRGEEPETQWTRSRSGRGGW
jgi:hypothetical protein